MPDHFHDDPAWQEAYEIKARNYQEAGFSPAAQAAAMRAELFFNGREAAFEKDFCSREGMSAEYAASLAKIGMIDDHGNMKNHYFEHLEAAGALDTERADFYARYKETPGASPGPQPSNDLEPDDEERRRAGRGGGGNPANASHSLNIRPDVVEGPAGLEVRTSMKSADYRADPDLKADLAEAERSAREDKQQSLCPPSAESERGANQQTLTYEAIERDPWNAVELPLPANADSGLLNAARSAAEYCAVGEHELMLAAHEGRYTPPEWTGAEGEPDVHEYNEARWFQADRRLELIDERIAQHEVRDASPDSANGYDAADYPGHTDESDSSDVQRDQVTQRGNEESTKRQDAERAARGGEDVPGDPASSATPSLAADLRAAEKAAKIEREAEGRELVTHDHGEGRTAAGGGGRGTF